MVIDSAGQMSYHPTLLYSNRRLHIIYAHNLYSDSAGIEVFYTSSDDYGLTWNSIIPLSTVEQPYYEHSQFPAAYADGNGRLIATWFDYKYGSYCGFSGDILARISTNNGADWLEESRLTYTQSGEASSCLIIGDSIYVAWMDDYPFGCSNPKIVFSRTTNWGMSWDLPEVITGPEIQFEGAPMLFSSEVGRDTIVNLVFDARSISGPARVNFIRNKSFLTRAKEMTGPEDVILRMRVMPNGSNKAVSIDLVNPIGSGISVEIFNVLGQIVWSTWLPGKGGVITWEARDQDGDDVASGIYFAKAISSDQSRSINLIILR